MTIMWLGIELLVFTIQKFSRNMKVQFRMYFSFGRTFSHPNDKPITVYEKRDTSGPAC